MSDERLIGIGPGIALAEGSLCDGLRGRVGVVGADVGQLRCKLCKPWCVSREREIVTRYGARSNAEKIIA